jgi:chromosomal replication initiator protein
MNELLWQQLNEGLKGQLREVHLTTWQRQVKPVSLSDETLRVAVPNKFIRDWIQDHFQKDVEKVFSEITGQSQSLSFEIDESIQALSSEAAEGDDAAENALEMSSIPAAAPKPAEGYVLNPRYVFNSFVVGPSNQFAHAACRAVAEAPAKNYNPLFLYGGVGLGKTHLLNAIGQEIIGRNPRTQIAYVSSEQFINKLVHSIRFDRMNQFRQMFRDSCDLLLIDDIQFIAGKERTQEEFFHTFDRLYNSGKQIVVSSDRPPNDIPGLEERVRSRFQWGLIADIQAPDMETRVAIVKKKADAARIKLSDDVANFLASVIKSNIRELEGSLVRLSAFASLLGQPITVDLAKEVLQSILGGNKNQLSIDRIQKTVADFYQIRLPDLLGRRRTRSLALPRQIAMYLCRKHIQASFPEIGNKFGGKDHSTVVHAVSKITHCMSEDETLNHQIKQLENRLEV